MDPNQPFISPGQQPVTTPPYPPVMNQPMPSSPETPPSHSNKRKIIIFVLIAALLLTVVPAIAMYFISTKKTSRSAAPIDAAPVAALAAKSSLSESDVAALDKTNAFWAYFKNASQQSVLTTTKEYYFSDSPTAEPRSRTFKQTGFDYKTKKIVQAIDMPDSATKDRMKYRCYDGKEFIRTSNRSSWREQEEKDKFYCQLGRESDAVNDGVNTGGLTADQAEAMIQTLRRQEGLVTVDRVELTNKQSKQYLRFDVTLHPILAKKEGIYMGNQWWMWAFKETGLDPATHPFAYIGAGGSGTSLKYYVDPATQLPVYSEIGTTPIKEKDGSDRPGDTYSFYRTQYTFGKLPDVATSNEQDIKLDW